MNYKDIPIRISYHSQGPNNIVDAFINPALHLTKIYKRSVGFFSSSVLTSILDGIEALVKNEGTIQLISSPKLSQEDIDAINVGYKEKERIVNDCFSKTFEEELEKIEDDKLILLAKLIASGVLDIKLALTDLQYGREESKYLKEINEAAKGRDEETSVEIDWWTLSRIESCLDMPKYKHIKQIYLCNKELDTNGYSLFYDYIYEQFSSESENELFGNVSLRDFYIEPTVNEKDAKGNNKTVRVFLESWIEQNNSIAVICGEPGHGKTSLCWKAMCDFYKNGWLSGKVSNVFCFSLNPSNTEFK